MARDKTFDQLTKVFAEFERATSACAPNVLLKDL